MSKWKKRIKKALKTAGKIAAIGGAGYLGAKAFGGRKGTASTNPIGGVDEIVRKKAIRDKAIDAGVLANVHDSESAMAPDRPWWKFKKGGSVKKQGYKDRKDESIAMRIKKKRTKKELRASADESYGKWGSSAKKSGKINRQLWVIYL